MELWQDRLAIVDVETTGSGAATDRVTEVAVLEVEGFELRSRWSSLINPGRPIAAPVQSLTGITDEMVAGAPRFGAIAAELMQRLEGRLFVAHNAAFDYGVLRRELERAGKRFEARSLCTVRLSRRLYPLAPGHDLDSLIARHRLACAVRHRAAADAEAVWQFLGAAAEEHGRDVLAVAARLASREVSLPPGLDRDQVEALPEAPGVYFFHGEQGELLYLGKARSLRSRVLEHCALPSSPGAARLAHQVRRVQWRRTVGELGALLLHEHLLRELSPAFNRRTKARAAGIPRPWPHRGPVGIVERDLRAERTEVHVVDAWRYLGVAADEGEIAELLESRRPGAFDWAHYRIFSRQLTRPGVRVVALSR